MKLVEKLSVLYIKVFFIYCLYDMVTLPNLVCHCMCDCLVYGINM